MNNGPKAQHYICIYKDPGWQLAQGSVTLLDPGFGAAIQNIFKHSAIYFGAVAAAAFAL